MLSPGRFNNMRVSRRTAYGMYLVATAPQSDVVEVLLPNKFVTPEMEVGQELNVFVYKDAEQRMVATTQIPLVIVGEAAYLLVKEVNHTGAFLDWGLDKDLLLPFSEQPERVLAGRYYLIFVYLDVLTSRIVASTNINKFIKNKEITLQPNEQVDLLVTYENDVGIRVIVNNRHWGMLYHNELFSSVEKGSRLKGYVKKVREDGKIDVALQKQGIVASTDIKTQLISQLTLQGGRLNVSDNTPPEVIYQLFGVSKKNFKKAIGMLYKEGVIELHQDYILLKTKPAKFTKRKK